MTTFQFFSSENPQKYFDDYGVVIYDLKEMYPETESRSQWVVDDLHGLQRIYDQDELVVHQDNSVDIFPYNDINKDKERDRDGMLW